MKSISQCVLFLFSLFLLSNGSSAFWSTIVCWGNTEYGERMMGRSGDTILDIDTAVDALDFSNPGNSTKSICTDRKSSFLLTEDGDVFLYGYDYDGVEHVSPVLIQSGVEEIECDGSPEESALFLFMIMEGREELLTIADLSGSSFSNIGMGLSGVTISTPQKVIESSLSNRLFVEIGCNQKASFIFSTDGSGMDPMIHGTGQAEYLMMPSDLSNFTRLNDSLLVSLINEGDDLRRIALGKDRFVFLIMTSGRVIFWGEEGYGAGCGISTDYEYPVLMDYSKCFDGDSIVSTLSGKSISDISCTDFGCIALDSEGGVHSWGSTTLTFLLYPQLYGRSVTNDAFIPKLIDFTNVDTVNYRTRYIYALDDGFIVCFVHMTTEIEKFYYFGGSSAPFWVVDAPKSILTELTELNSFLTSNLIKSKPSKNYGNEGAVFILSTTCDGMYANDSLVCGSHGDCLPSSSTSCDCEDGYLGNYCDYWLCDGRFSYEESTCGVGNCTAPEVCECKEGYATFNGSCDAECFGYIGNEPGACSGHGFCDAPEHCSCDAYYKGTKCDEDDKEAGVDYFWIAPVIISVLFICCCCCVILLFLLVSIPVLLFAVRRLRYFNKLEDFDLHLEEQEMDQMSEMPSFRITQDLFQVDYDSITVLEIIGSGGGGATVFKAKWKSQIIALKSFKTRDLCSTQERFDEFEREVSILASLSHPYIIKFFGASMKQPKVAILIEYCENGDLKHYLEEKTASGGVSFEEKIRLILQICSAMDFLHSKEIIHRDMKCENVLVDGRINCKVMDFGLSKLANTDQSKTKGIGTSIFMAPEIVRGEDYDERCDVFSFAIMMYEIIGDNFHPYGNDVEFVEFKVANSPFFRPDLRALQCPKWIKNLIERCWQDNPEKRFLFEDIIRYLEEKNDEKKKQTLIVYLKQSGEDDGDAIDFLLDDLTVKGLKELIWTKTLYGREMSEKEQNYEMKIWNKTFTDENEKLEEIKTDKDISLLEDDCLIEVKFYKLEKRTKTAPPVSKEMLLEKVEKKNMELKRTLGILESKLKHLFEKRELTEGEKKRLMSIDNLEEEVEGEESW